MMLTTAQMDQFRETGHLTVPHVLTAEHVASLLDDVSVWGDEFLAQLSDDKRAWYLESGDDALTALRKLDNPHYHRPLFRELAASPEILAIVEQIIGPGVSVFFSQVFCKPAGVGGPKPVHQDNFYFGPDAIDATLTVWIALDTATIENGCLYYADGSNRGPIYEHVAPQGEPFNLQIAAEHLSDFEMTPAPVPSGGLSLHHGNTWHQSSSNTSPHSRRAAALHYLQNDATLTAPSLAYDPELNVRVS